MRFSTRVVIFLLFLNAGAVAIGQAGVAADMGISPVVGGDDAINQANQSASDISAGGGFAGTLFGLFTSAAGTMIDVFAVAFAGPTMLSNLGVPGWMVGFVFTPLYLLVGIDVIYVLTGRGP